MRTTMTNTLIATSLKYRGAYRLSHGSSFRKWWDLHALLKRKTKLMLTRGPDTIARDHLFPGSSIIPGTGTCYFFVLRVPKICRTYICKLVQLFSLWVSSFRRCLWVIVFENYHTAARCRMSNVTIIPIIMDEWTIFYRYEDTLYVYIRIIYQVAGSNIAQHISYRFW